MGTINHKGHKKLPPAPVALNELEVENFGLEALESEERKKVAEGDVILDSAETDNKDAEMDKDAEMEEIVQKTYLGLRVNDMIKVTAKNKFFNEDGIVKRLKDDKVFILFYTYGSMFDEWLDPGDVRKLTEVEILKGLSGPSQPVTQEDMDGPRDSRIDSREPREDRRNMNQGLGDNQRNRRQDHIARDYKGSGNDDRKAEENWNRYKDNERRNTGGRHSDGDVDIRGSNPRTDWAGGDVDSQWGRSTERGPRDDQRRPPRDDQRQQQKERRPNQPKRGADDWSSFVSPVSSQPSKVETDDFFASLMTDLSKDLDDGSDRGSGGKESTGSTASSQEDDFFASLMSEISEDTESTQKTSGASNNEEQLYASSSEDTGKKGPKKTSDASTDLDEFFSEISASDSGLKTTSSDQGKSAESEADDFFASLEDELNSELSEVGSVSEEPSREEESSPATSEVIEKSSPKPKANKAAAPSKVPPSADNHGDFSKCTVPVLKDMLKSRGLKVSGKKAELIERLSTAQ
jgi:hypothetical protein